jgi:hypothetical protein
MLNFFNKTEPNSHTSCSAGIAPEWKVVKHHFCREYQGKFVIYGNAGKSLIQILGRVVEWGNLPVDVYLFNPPRTLRMHPHGRCLQLVTPNDGWFKLHWERPARTFDEARAYVENLIFDAMKKY